MTFFKAFFSVSVITFLSRLLGLCRDVVIAAVFGAGAVTDAFFAAFRLPNMLRRFSAEGAMSQAFIPVYAEQQKQNREAAKQLAGEMMAALAMALLAVSAVGIVLAPWLMAALAPGLTEAALAADLFRIVFPYIVLVSLVALGAGVLNTDNYFNAAAAAPLLFNVVLIAAAWGAADWFAQPIFALAWGVVGGGIVQLAWVLWHLRRAGAMPPLRWVRRLSAQLWRVLRLMSVGVLGAGAAQFNLLINLFIASFLAAGSISWLYYADRLMELPVGLLGAALTTVVLPALARHADDDETFARLTDLALRIIVVLALPAAVGLVVLALPLVATLFLSGAFDRTDALMTQQAVYAYGIGVFGLAAVRPLAAAFFARQDFKTPVKTALMALVITQCLNAVLIFGFGLAHTALALSVGLAATANSAVLWWLLWRRGWWRAVGGGLDARFVGRVAAALAAMSAVLWWLHRPDEFWLTADWGERWLTLLGQLAAAIITYFTTLRLTGLRPAHFRLNL